MSIEELACAQKCPPPGFDVPLERRVSCNRIAGHDGPHRRIRARDFKVMVEWTEQGGFTIAAGRELVKR